MRYRCVCFLIILAAHAICPSTFAIIRRHDREDARYLELGAKYQSVTRLGGGTATLIEPSWLLTAGHVAENLSPFAREVTFNGKAYSIQGIVQHPKSRQRPRQASVDMALVKLSTPVEGVTPVGVYAKEDEVGREVVFVGPGMFGDGKTGPQGDDGKMRGATNIVSGAKQNYITFTFDAPPRGTELEGISGPGDSGGPALIEVDGQTFIIGVSSANDDEGAAGPCRYGSTEYYARVSKVSDWIAQTISSELPPQEELGSVVDLQQAPWPETRAGQMAAAFFDAYARQSDEAMETFERKYRADSALRERPIGERIASWREYRSVWGQLRASKYVDAGATGFHVLVRAEKEGVWKSFRFELDAKQPQKLIGIAIASPVVGE